MFLLCLAVTEVQNNRMFVAGKIPVYDPRASPDAKNLPSRTGWTGKNSQVRLVANVNNSTLCDPKCGTPWTRGGNGHPFKIWRSKISNWGSAGECPSKARKHGRLPDCFFFFWWFIQHWLMCWSQKRRGNTYFLKINCPFKHLFWVGSISSKVVSFGEVQPQNIIASSRYKLWTAETL